MNCLHCDNSFNDVHKYVFHLEYVNKQDTFTCYVENCLRSFHRKDSFKKHIFTHGFNESLNKLNVLSVPTIEIESSDSNLNTKCCSDNNTLEDIPQFLLDNNTLEDIQSFLKKLGTGIQHLVVQLYDNLSLTKSDIQKIIEIIHNFFSQLLNGLEQIILNCNLNELVSSFKTILKYFDNFNTEYKRESFFEKKQQISLDHHRLL